MNKLILGDCVEVMQTLESNSIDGIVTDPPYNLSFMNASWDSFKSNKQFQEWTTKWSIEALRILKPGALMFVFGGTRTFHRIFSGVEDANFEVRDCMMWLYCQGWPKILDIAKKFDEYYGYEIKLNKNKLRVQPAGTLAINSKTPGRPKFGTVYGDKGQSSFTEDESEYYAYEPTCDKAKEYNGYKTSLKPAYEPIGLFQKPREGTYIENILKWDIGALNIDDCRIPINVDLEPDNRIRDSKRNIKRNTEEGSSIFWGDELEGYVQQLYELKGRYPSNIIIDEMMAEIMDIISEGKTSKGHWSKTKVSGYGDFGGGKSEYYGKGEYSKDSGGLSKYFQKIKFHANVNRQELGSDSVFNKDNCGYKPPKEGISNYGDPDGLSKYFHKVPFRYVPKAHKNEKNLGLEDIKPKRRDTSRNKPIDNPYNRNKPVKNFHKTVKPIKLLCYLIRMIKPPSRRPIILDPFLGSGSTAIACKIENCDYNGIEKNPEYMEIAKKRLAVPLEKYQKYTDSQVYSGDENQKRLTSFKDWL